MVLSLQNSGIKHKLLYYFGVLILTTVSHAQVDDQIFWWNPLQQDSEVIEGQAWAENLESGFDRLPHSAKEKVSRPLWNLSKNSAGLSLRFRTNASNIFVKYKLLGELSMPHMPATGVSGLDLYAKDSDGKWLWISGNYSFGENASYNFSNLKPNDNYHDQGREYKLLLPLYNSVDSLFIGIPKSALFVPLNKKNEKPIVVYGTSIAQGACASRPGMAWTSILERKMDWPLINLGFSGNGLLEDAIIDQMNEIDAKAYVLDCLPNLAPNVNRTLTDVFNLILKSVNNLRAKNSTTPILLVEHAGYSDDSIHEKRKKTYTDLNQIMKEAFQKLKTEGMTHLYLLTKEEINLNLDATVDGIHPNDLGMLIYAQAYEKTLREILNQPIGEVSTTKPVSQSREWKNYKWEERHQQLKDMNTKHPPKICFIGNSIVHFWGGYPKGPLESGGDSWKASLEELDIRNFGFGWDRIENVLWRVYHGELDGFDAEQIVLMLGTNNLHLNTNDEIIEGLNLLIEAIKIRQPMSKIRMVGILPRRENEPRLVELNSLISNLSKRANVYYTDIGSVLLKENGEIDESLFRDGLHPNEEGYNKLAPKLAKYLMK